jgi:sugar lactone lactonase YvrE
MRLSIFGATLAVLLPVAAGCDYDHAAPNPPAPPAAPVPEGIWTVSGSPSALLRLAVDQLSGTGGRTPVTEISTPSANLFTLMGVAFDKDGVLWIASQDDSLLLAFPPGALAGSGSRTAATIISPIDRSLSGPTGLAFDAPHHLWVVNSESATLVRFDPGQLVAGGAQVPAVMLSLSGHPTALAFDADGSLWVSDIRFHTIVKYPAERLAVSGSPVPTLVLTEANSLVNPAGLAFDATGNLWVANTGAESLVAFSPAQLAGIGPAAPHIEIASTGSSLRIPVGLAFDGEGNLWVVGGEGALTKYAAASLGASGAVAPISRLDVSGHTLFWSLAFWPKPAGLPLN